MFIDFERERYIMLREKHPWVAFACTPVRDWTRNFLVCGKMLQLTDPPARAGRETFPCILYDSLRGGSSQKKVEVGIVKGFQKSAQFWVGTGYSPNSVQQGLPLFHLGLCSGIYSAHWMWMTSGRNLLHGRWPLVSHVLFLSSIVCGTTEVWFLENVYWPFQRVGKLSCPLLVYRNPSILEGFTEECEWVMSEWVWTFLWRIFFLVCFLFFNLFYFPPPQF